MYRKHFNLEQLPFRNTPDPRFYYQTDKHQEAMANLLYAVEQRRGFVMLSGEIGSGKTLVTHLLLQQIESHALVALIRNTHLNSTQLIRLICDEFSVRVGEHSDKASMLLSLNQFLVQQLSEDRIVVVIIDEAQNLSDRVLEELRMLSNLETSTDKLIQIVLIGQPELRDKVSQPHLEQLRTRIALSYHLESLTPEEVRQYINHRLHVAGPNHRVRFTDEAVDKIARFSRGTPRVVNGVCDNALLYGFTANTTVIDEHIIDKVIRQSMHMAPRQKVGPVRTPSYTYPVAAETYSAPEESLSVAPPVTPSAPTPIVLPMSPVPQPRAVVQQLEHTAAQPASITSSTSVSVSDVVTASAATVDQAPPISEQISEQFDVPSVAPQTAETPTVAVTEPVSMSQSASIAKASVMTKTESEQSNSQTTSVPSSHHKNARVWSDSVITAVPAEALFGIGR